MASPADPEGRADALDRRIAGLAAVAIAIHVLEAGFPSPVPGIKPGLANVVTLIALLRHGVACAAWVAGLRVLVGSLLVGSFLTPTFWLSATGALCAFAALAGVCLAMFPRSVEINLAFVALAAFPAVLVGGLESLIGAVVAGLLLGVLQVLAQGYINPLLGHFGHNFHAVFPYVVMILFLMFRPEGLFGHQRVKRV